MKTAEEWMKDKDSGFGFAYIDDIQPLRINIPGNYSTTDLIKQIQLDAWNSALLQTIALSRIAILKYKELGKCEHEIAGIKTIIEAILKEIRN